MCVPLAIISAVRIGSVARVATVMIAAPATASGILREAIVSISNSRLTRAANCSHRSKLRPNTRMRLIDRTARAAATCVIACLPVPIIAKSSAAFAANKFVATPEALAVRNCPRANASMIAFSAPVSLSKRISKGVAPPCV